MDNHYLILLLYLILYTIGLQDEDSYDSTDGILYFLWIAGFSKVVVCLLVAFSTLFVFRRVLLLD